MTCARPLIVAAEDLASRLDPLSAFYFTLSPAICYLPKAYSNCSKTLVIGITTFELPLHHVSKYAQLMIDLRG